MEKEKATLDSNVTSVLTKDGVGHVNLDQVNQNHYRAKDYIKKAATPGWAQRIIYNERMSGVLICQEPGTGNRTHYHPVDDEWWVVLMGSIKWWMDGIGEIHAETGDVVFVPRGVKHKIRTAGTGPSIRLAISPPDIPHTHPDIDPAPADF
jgi:quercetin dioxygenase-like cupin family protein